MPQPAPEHPIYIGTSGWSYDDWRGRWYPPGIPRAKMLDYYAGVFNAAEVNATYYRTPPRASAEGIVRIAAGRLTFAVKAPGDLTHGGSLDDAMLTPWLTFLEPFREGECLGAVLLQFPQRFHRDAENLRYFDAVRVRLADLPLVAEFRHSSWDNPEANRMLMDLEVSRSMLDQPVLKGLSCPGALRGCGSIRYLRLHGRNAREWHGTEEGANRYRYSYSREELEEWAPVLRETGGGATSTYVFFNNHPDGNAPRDAETLARLLNVPLRGSGYTDMFS